MVAVVGEAEAAAAAVGVEWDVVVAAAVGSRSGSGGRCRSIAAAAAAVGASALRSSCCSYVLTSCRVGVSLPPAVAACHSEPNAELRNPPTEALHHQAELLLSLVLLRVMAVVVVVCGDIPAWG